MSNDATDRPARIYDERTFSVPWQEPLALKMIYDGLNEAEAPSHFCRNVLLYYFALTQLVAMRGNGCVLRTKDLERWSLIHHDSHPECRQFLEDLRLIRVEERMEGGNRKTLFVFLLRAPFADAAERHRENIATEGPLERVDERPDAAGRHVRSSEVTTTTTSVLRTDDAAGVSRDETTDESTDAPVQPTDEPSSDVGRDQQRSLKEWTRQNLAEHHAASPDSPPEGTTEVRAMVCALATTPGAEVVFGGAEPPGSAYGRVGAALTRKYRGMFNLSYRDWMTAALSFERAPVPKVGKPSLEYWLAAIAQRATKNTVAAFEQEHYRIKRGDHKAEIPPERRITPEELTRILAGEVIAD